jgi:hypothetical protein
MIPKTVKLSGGCPLSSRTRGTIAAIPSNAPSPQSAYRGPLFCALTLAFCRAVLSAQR